MFYTWEDGVVMDCGVPVYADFLLEQTDWLDPLYADLPAYFLTTAVCLAAGAACWRRAAGKISSE